MAYTQGSIGDLGDTLKILYPDVSLDPMLNNEQVVRPKLLTKVPSGSRVSEGGTVKFPAVLMTSQNGAQIGDNKVFPLMKDGLDKQMTLAPTLFADGLQLGYMTAKGLKTGASAYGAPLLQRRTEECLASLGKFMEQSYVSAYAGKRGVVASSTATTVTLANPMGARLLKENMLVSVRTAADITAAQDTLDGVIISKIDYDTNTLTLLTDAGAAPTCTNAVAGDFIYVVSDGAALTTLTTGAIQVLAGLFANSIRELIDDGTYSTTLHGLTRSTYPRLNSQISSNGGSLRNIDEFLITRLAGKIRQRSQKRPTDILCGPGQAEMFAKYVSQARRYPVVSGKQAYTTGFQNEDLAHTYPGGVLRFTVSDDVIPREMFLLNMDTFFLHKAQEPSWIDDGGRLHLTPQTGRFRASYQAMIAAIENLGVARGDANGVIRDLADAELGDTVE